MGSSARTLILIAFIAQFCARALTAADSPRRYADGPMTPADFRAAVPDPPPMKDGVRLRAVTHSEIRYTTRYHWEESKPGTVTASLTRFDCHSQLLCDKCWNRAPMDLRLLDHEQGHFDIAELNARQGQKIFDKLIADKTLVGHGRDERSAVADLDKKVRDEMKAVFDQENDEQIEYDRATNHGREFAAQAKQRKLIDERLKQSEQKK
jgi:hypothetical protein